MCVRLMGLNTMIRTLKVWEEEVYYLNILSHRMSQVEFFTDVPHSHVIIDYKKFA